MLKQFPLRRSLGTVCLFFVFGLPCAQAQRVTSSLEYHVIDSVGYPWTPVAYLNTYADPVIVCSYVLASNASPSATVRVDPVSATGFNVRIQQFENSASVTPGTVYCIVSEAGVFTLPGGMTYEAQTVFSDETSGSAVGWQQSRLEPLILSASFTTPVLVGQVMSFNDVRASVFHATDCESRGNRPFQSGFADGACVGKHVGQINATRASETLGVIVVESGSASANNFNILAGRTLDNVRGVGNSPPYNNSVSGDFDMGVATQAGEDGGQGGWWVFYGADPLPNGQIRGAIEEEVLAGDKSRTHTTEEALYWLFDDNNLAELSVDKTAPTTSFDEAGETVTFSFEIENTGNTEITGITLVDDQIGAVTCPATSLLATADMTCTATYTVTPADVAAGSVTNIATADGVSFYGALGPGTDSWTLTYTDGPSDLTVEKSVETFIPTGYAIPGEDLIYTLTVTNAGAGSPDADTLFLVDALPDEVEMFTGDMDAGGPASDAVYFTQTGTSLTLTYASDVGYSISPVRPASMAECAYTPVPGVYDPLIRYICFNPKGTMPGADPDPSFDLSFRVRLK